MVALHIALKKKVNMRFFNKQPRGKSAPRVELPINTNATNPQKLLLGMRWCREAIKEPMTIAVQV
jgi:hypothetical protein